MANLYDFTPEQFILGNGNEVYIAANTYQEHRGLSTPHPYVLLDKFLMDRFLEKSGRAPTTKTQYIVHRNSDQYDCRIGNLLVMDRYNMIRFLQLTGKDVPKRLSTYVVHGPFKIQKLQREVMFTSDEEINWEYNPYDIKEFMEQLEKEYMEQEIRKQDFLNSKLEKVRERVHGKVRSEVEGSNILITVADNIVMINDGFTVMPQIFNRQQGQALVVSIIDGKIEIKKASAVE